MSHALVLLWLGTSSARAARQPDLDSWQRAHQIAIEAPAPDASAGPGYDPALVRRLEKLLDEARILAGSLDEKTALARLGSVDRLLHSHPELPQAAWLMAERLEIEADVLDRRVDGSPRAAELRWRARSLEGRRAESYTTATETHEAKRGDAKAPPRPPPAARPAAPAPHAVVRLAAEGLVHADRLYVDGRRVARRLALAPGEHHARVVRRGRAVWAGWFHVTAGDTALDLPVPAPAACSLDDLGGVRLDAGRVVVPSHVRCRHWAVALPSARADGVRVATCHGASCGPPLVWRREFGGNFAGPAQPTDHHRWPTWATYLLTGVGVAATAGIVMWRAGAFAQPGTSRSVWKYQAPLRF